MWSHRFPLLADVRVPFHPPPLLPRRQTRRRYFERTGQLLTIDGRNDDRIGIHPQQFKLVRKREDDAGAADLEEDLGAGGSDAKLAEPDAPDEDVMSECGSFAEEGDVAGAGAGGGSTWRWCGGPFRRGSNAGVARFLRGGAQGVPRGSSAAPHGALEAHLRDDNSFPLWGRDWVVAVRGD